MKLNNQQAEALRRFHEKVTRDQKSREVVKANPVVRTGERKVPEKK